MVARAPPVHRGQGDRLEDHVLQRVLDVDGRLGQTWGDGHSLNLFTHSFNYLHL